MFLSDCIINMDKGMLEIRSIENRAISQPKALKKTQTNTIINSTENTAPKAVKSHSLLGDVVLGGLIYITIKVACTVIADNKEGRIARQKELINIEKVKKAVTPEKFCYYQDSVGKITNRNEKALAWGNIANEVEKALKVLK